MGTAVHRVDVVGKALYVGIVSAVVNKGDLGLTVAVNGQNMYGSRNQRLFFAL